MTLQQAIAKLRALNEPVPKPMHLPTEAQVHAAEQELGVKFHPDFKRYLLEASDVVVGALEPVTVTDPEAHTDLLEVCDGAWEQSGVPRKLLPICEDNGDYFCMNSKGEVVYWSHNGESDEKWPNLAAWIDEVWLGEADDEEEDD